MKLFNTLSRQLEEVKVQEDGYVHIYNCGPTVYGHMHVGNIRAYVCWDILHRALKISDYKVKRIMNITDVGHLTSDEDLGEDKLEKSAKKEGVTPYDVADYYTKSFINDFRMLNILSPSGEVIPEEIDVHNLKSYGWTRATMYVNDMVVFIKELETNGFAYETSTAVYFDVSKYDEYTKLSGQRIEDKLEGVRDEVIVDVEKKNPVDFALWMKRVGEHKDHYMHWSSPWGDGFPGWHIECSVMGAKELDGRISIHTGGVDHISVHHTNERAQNYGYFKKEIVDMWVHNEFLTGDKGDKLSKSAGTGFTLTQILELGYLPVHLRYLFTTVNYRIPMVFSPASLEGARKSYEGLIKRVLKVSKKANGSGHGVILSNYKDRFIQALNEDLNVSLAISLTYELLDSDNSPEDILETVYLFDSVWGFGLKEVVNNTDTHSENSIGNSEVSTVLDKRKQARENKDYRLSDELRDKLLELGYRVIDTPDGQSLEPINAKN